MKSLPATANASTSAACSDIDTAIGARNAPADKLPHALRTDRMLGFTRIAGALAVILGVLGLMHWWLSWSSLDALGTHRTAMAPNSAAMCLLAGLSLWSRLIPHARACRWTIPLALATGSLALLTLAQYMLGIDLRIDAVLVAAAASEAPRPTVETAMGILLLSIALVSLCGSSRIAHRLSEGTALAAGSVALLALLGILFGIEGMEARPAEVASGMALPTALAVLALACGTLTSRPHGALVALLASDELGAAAARRLLYVLLGTPVLALILQVGVVQGWYNGPAALAAGVFIALAAMAGAIVGNARQLNAALLLRRREVDQLRLAAVVFEAGNEAILVTDEQGTIVRVNRACERITGYSAADMLGRNPRLLKSHRHERAFYEAMWRELAGTDAWQGEMWNRRKDGSLYATLQNISAIRDDAGRVTHYVSMLSDITAHIEAEARLSHLAHHDPLTGLPNRALFQSTLERAIAHGRRHTQRVALLFIDLDHFKLINDTLGHPAGDELLEAVAERLRSNVRGQDTVSRLGGDEFTVLVEEAGSREDLAHLARKLIDLVALPLRIEGRSVAPSASVGIAVFPDDAGTPVDLTRAADAALYRAKASGRRTFGFYTEELTREAAQRLAVEARLYRALEAHELRLHYQPQFELATGRYVGMEALLRWQHPDEGLLLPQRFIAAAEESKLIDAIGAWVLHEACAQARRWLDDGLQPRRIAVNLSGRQFHGDPLALTVAHALHAAGLDRPGCPLQMEVEVTETVLYGDERSAATLQALRDMDVHVSIDDFGTGYSSLSVLKHLPIDALKIDQLFVRGLPDDTDSLAIAKAIVSMAHSLGLRVLAEGVETDAQRECLRSFGCDEFQGFLCARPMAHEQARAWLQAMRACTPLG